MIRVKNLTGEEIIYEGEETDISCEKSVHIDDVKIMCENIIAGLCKTICLSSLDAIECVTQK